MSTANLSFTQKSWRLSPMYLFYFALFGSFVPYVARFLTTNGLTEQEASWVVAVVMGVNFFAPFLFSYLADKTGRRMVFIRLGYVSIGVFYLLSLFGSGFWFYLIVFGLFGIFLSAVLPQMESVTLSVLGEEKKRYGQIRLWGSLGFVGVVALVGKLLDIFGVNIIVYFGVGFSVLMFLSTYLVPERPKNKDKNQTSSHVESEDFPIDWVQVCVLLAVVLLWQFALAPYNTFFDLYLQANGSTATLNGILIAFGTLCEIGVFLIIATLFSHFSERALICAGLILTAARWLLLAYFPDIFWIVLLSQTLHAATYGVVHSVAIHRIGHLFPESKASFGQGLYVALGTGLGLFVGNILAGYFWDGSSFVYLLAAALTFFAVVIAFFGIKDTANKNAN